MIDSYAGTLLTVGPRKLSIPNRRARNKDFIMKRAAGTSFIGLARVGRGGMVKPRERIGSFECPSEIVQPDLQSAQIS